MPVRVCEAFEGSAWKAAKLSTTRKFIRDLILNVKAGHTLITKDTQCPMNYVSDSPHIPSKMGYCCCCFNVLIGMKCENFVHLGENVIVILSKK